MFWGIGKKRTKLGRFIDEEGYAQQELEKVANVSKNTVTRLCNDHDYIPSQNVMKKVLIAIRKIKPDAKINDFWDM